MTAGLVSPTPYNQDVITYSTNKNAMPDISVALPGGADYAAALSSGQLDNQNLWSTHYDGLSGNSIKDRVTGAKLDGTFDVDSGIFKHIDAGISYLKRSKSRRDIDNDWTNGSNQYSSLYNTLDGQPGPITFASMGADVISTFKFHDFFGGAGGNFPRTQVLINAQELLDGLKSLDGTPNYTSGTGTYNFADSLPQFNPTNSYVVNEETYSGYVEASFGGSRWSGNLGVRVVKTNTSASTAINQIISVTVADTANPTSSGVLDYSEATPLSAKGSYTIPLPAANFNFAFRDNLHLRLGVAQTVARPNLNQFAPTETDNASNQDYTVTYDWQRGAEADQGVAGGCLARMVLREERPPLGGSVRQEAARRHHHDRADRPGYRRGRLLQRKCLHAAAVQRDRADQRRHRQDLRRRDQLAAHALERPRHPRAIYADVEPREDRRRECRTRGGRRPDDLLDQSVLRARTDLAERLVGSYQLVPLRDLHRGGRRAGDRQGVRLGHRDRVLRHHQATSR